MMIVIAATPKKTHAGVVCPVIQSIPAQAPSVATRPIRFLASGDGQRLNGRSEVPDCAYNPGVTAELTTNTSTRCSLSVGQPRWP